MSLLARIRDNEECRVVWCHEARVEGAEFCGSAGSAHLTDFWQQRLRELADGTYIVTAGPQVRLAAKDLTGSPA